MRYHRHLLCSSALLALLGWTAMPAYAQVGGASGGSGGSRTSSSGSSSSGTSVGGGFTGGGSSTGGGFTGGTGSSGSSMTSGGFTGTTTSTTGKGGGSSTAVPSQSNPLFSTYANPLNQGLLDITGKPTSNKAFGQASYPLYSGSGTTGGGGAFGGGTGSSSTTAFGYNTGGIVYPSNYITVAGDSLPPVVHAAPKLQAAVADVLSRSTVVRPNGIKLQVDGSTVIIEGTVASAKDKRIIEGMIRMTPGVRSLVSNLEVSETLPNPKTGQSLGQ